MDSGKRRSHFYSHFHFALSVICRTLLCVVLRCPSLASDLSGAKVKGFVLGQGTQQGRQHSPGSSVSREGQRCRLGPPVPHRLRTPQVSQQPHTDSTSSCASQSHSLGKRALQGLKTDVSLDHFLSDLKKHQSNFLETLRHFI